MKKLITSFFLIFMMLSLMFCTQKTVYFTPEFSGYIYDSKTKLPLNSLAGNIGVNGVVDLEDTKIQLNQKGKFHIPAKTKNYYYTRPSVKPYLHGSGDLLFAFPNYKTKRVEYAELYVAQVPEEIAGFDHLNKINMGIIYLDPK